MNSRSRSKVSPTTDVTVETVSRSPVAQQETEIVERKGLGHPDTICDAIHEKISVALCRAYQHHFGRVMHHNIDKGLLVAGLSEPRIGGGRIVEPMRLVIGDRATSLYRGTPIDVDAIVFDTVSHWCRKNLRFVEFDRHLIIQNELRHGSMQLSDIFERQTIGANDTSAAVGYAPLTETEQMVLDAENFLNSALFKHQFPESGEDVKIMGCRRGRKLELTVAMAFVDRHIPNERFYFERKREIQFCLEKYLSPKMQALDRISVAINTLDDPARGAAGMYLTVLGTSADGADGGQVGRGNRANGLIALNRPCGNEATAGKNPISHVGKIYSMLTHRIAEDIYRRISGLAEVYVWLCSRIGSPIDQPMLASVQVALSPDTSAPEMSAAAIEIVEEHLHGIPNFSDQLAQGLFSVC
ncbi:methionine adenosyltransferase [Desulfatitalea tepidiphila]|uniref:methionine adenosyltransferase n=1 Tax=Desulfatitalea tepidiphila TaxID=1185843 RepID=UPI0006B4777A|nr:methionine adenosyltransferase [Desulfatitalea tepidiphila]